MIEHLRTLAEGLDHPEGVALGPDGALYAGGEDGQVYRIDPQGGHEQLAHHPGRFYLGVASDGRGRLYLCDMNDASVVCYDPARDTLEPWCEAASGTRLVCPNWGAFAEDGTLWLTDSGQVEAPSGSIVRVPPGGGDGERLDLPPLPYPNGCALADDGALYVVESLLPGIVVIREGERAVLSRLERTVPDGLALTADGDVLVASFQPNAILRVPAGGGPAETLAEDWTGQALLTPTNVAFFGPELDRLAIATICGWSITALDMPFRGRRIPLPDGNGDPSGT